MHCLSWEKIMLKFFNIFYSHNSQPDIEGLFSCLDIWGVFLDYLTSKVSNARSDKLAEAEATVSRYGQVLKSIYRVGIWASVKQVLWLLSYHYIWYPFDNFLPFMKKPWRKEYKLKSWCVVSGFRDILGCDSDMFFWHDEKRFQSVTSIVHPSSSFVAMLYLHVSIF